jgi:deoxyribodipyrimidine photo-lyase
MLCQRYQIDAVTWNRCYEPYAIERDTQLKQTLKSLDCVVSSCSGSLLYEPWVAVKKDGTAYRVFTPFYKHCQANLTRRSTTALDPAGQDWITPESATGIEALGLRPSPEWDQGLLEHWVPGEVGAEARLSEFLASGLTDYRVGRDYPAERSVSRLSPHLHHGEISPHQILERLQAFPTDDNHEHFVRELVWREFAYHLLYHFPELPHRNLQSKFDHFPWTG